MRFPEARITTQYLVMYNFLYSWKYAKKFSVSPNNCKSRENSESKKAKIVPSPKRTINFIASMENHIEARNIFDLAVISKDRMWGLSYDVLYCSIPPRMITQYQIKRDSWNSRNYAVKFLESGMYILGMMAIKLLEILLEHRSMGLPCISVSKDQMWRLLQAVLFCFTDIMNNYAIHSWNSQKHTKKVSVSQNSSKFP